MKKASNIRVLCVLPTLNDAGGIEKNYMGLYKNFNPNIEVDFVTYECDSSRYRKLIDEKGGRLIVLEKMGFRNRKKAVNDIRKVLDNEYDIVHCNALNYAYYYLKTAKKKGVQIRILHAHISRHSDSLLKSIRNRLLFCLSKKYVTHRWACGDNVGKKIFKKKQYDVLYNAINFHDNVFDTNKRHLLRKRYGIADDETVLLNVGRMVKAKNQAYLIMLLSKLEKKYTLCFVGGGKLKKQLLDKAKKSISGNKVIFVPPTSDVGDYYCMADLLLMPSRTEGLPMTAIEAQAYNLPVICSNKVTNEVRITDKCWFIPIHSPELWIKTIAECKCNEAIRKKKLTIEKDYFSLDKQSVIVQRKYEEYMRESGGNYD